jgi:hypothetical protein
MPARVSVPKGPVQIRDGVLCEGTSHRDAKQQLERAGVIQHSSLQYTVPQCTVEALLTKAVERRARGFPSKVCLKSISSRRISRSSSLSKSSNRGFNTFLPTCSNTPSKTNSSETQASSQWLEEVAAAAGATTATTPRAPTHLDMTAVFVRNDT